MPFHRAVPILSSFHPRTLIDTHRYSYQPRGTLDVDLMRRAIKHFLGTHDFSHFCTRGGKASQVRTIVEVSLDVQPVGDDTHVRDAREQRKEGGISSALSVLGSWATKNLDRPSENAECDAQVDDGRFARAQVIRMRFTGNGFLKVGIDVCKAVVYRRNSTMVHGLEYFPPPQHQVRRMVGMLISVGQGNHAPKEVANRLRARAPGERLGRAAVAKGLFLDQIWFQGQPCPPASALQTFTDEPAKKLQSTARPSAER